MNIARFQTAVQHLRQLERRGLVEIDSEALARAIERYGVSKTPTADDGDRWQDDVIIEMIGDKKNVLDIGCGSGELLARLKIESGCRIQGVELDLEEAHQCIARGVPVIQADIDEGLKGYPDGSFDFVILEETLQTLYNPIKVLKEMLRVGRYGIVTFPNFGHWRHRLDLLFKGRMPVNERLPYRWHDTPNIHLLTVADFRDWCEDARVTVAACTVLVDGKVRPCSDGDNMEADEVVFLVKSN